MLAKIMGLSQIWTPTAMDKHPSCRYDFFMSTLLSAFAYAFTSLLCLQVHAAQFKYNELMLKDYDEMLQMVNAKLKKARALSKNTSDTSESTNDQEVIEHLREAVKLILSRPDSDNMVAKLIPEVRKELSGYNAFEDVLSGIAAEEVAIMKDKKAANTAQATAVFVLENLISLLKPEAVNNNDVRRIFDRIRSADIEISDGVKHDMKLRGMFKTANPSQTAKAILKSLPPPKDPKKEQQKDAKKSPPKEKDDED